MSAKMELRWMEENGHGRGLRIDHNEYCTDCPKHIVLSAGGVTVDIHTDEKGLKEILAALNGHAGDLKKQALVKARDALQIASSFGVSLEDLQKQVGE